MSISSIASSTMEKKMNIQKARENCKTNRFMSQKLKEQLRKKFYDHVHTARRERFDETRKELEKVLKQELSELENDIGLQEKIFEEVLEEMNEWIVAEMTKEADYLVDIIESDELICPMCQKHALTVKEQTSGNKNIYQCNCGINFTFAGNLQQLKETLHKKVDCHDMECRSSLSFFLEPELETEYHNLGLMCDKCDFFLVL